jgi:peptide/nickel transport system substrate-binding protein
MKLPRGGRPNDVKILRQGIGRDGNRGGSKMDGNQRNYWTRGGRTVSRRRFALGTGTLAAGTAALLAGCGDDDTKATGTAAGTASGAATTAASGQPTKGGTLLNYKTGPDQGIDPQVTVLGVANEFMGWAYSSMHTIKLSTNEVVLDLATKYEQPDASTLIFTLRDGVKFHNIAPMNGRALTAEDAKYTWQRLPGAAKNLGSQVVALLWEFADLAGAGVTIPDPKTIKINFKFPYASALAAMGSFGWDVVAREAVESKQYAPEGTLKITAGSGPYLVGQSDAQGTRLDRNPDYYQRTDAKAPYVNGGPYLDHIDTRIVADRAAYKAAFLNGQLDYYAPADAVEMKQLESEKKWNTLRTKSVQCLSLMVDVRPGPDPKLWDARARQAVSLAIDREEFIATVLGGDGVYGGPIATHFPFALSQDELKKLQPFDPKKAKELWSAAGAPLKTIRFFTGTDTFSVNASRFVAAQLEANLGVKTVVNAVEGGAYVSQAIAPGQKVWDVGVNGNGAAVPLLPEYDNLSLYLPSAYAGNYYGFTLDNPDKAIAEAAAQVEKLHKEQQSLVDVNARSEKLKELQRYIINNNLAHIPLPHTASEYRVVNNRLKGFDPADGAYSTYFYRQQDLWIKA